MSLLAPTTSAERIASIDVLRGVAVLGILLMNIVGFGLPYQAFSNPTVAGGDSGSNLGAWWIASVFFEGTMRTIFSMLFGAGTLLFLARTEAKSTGLEPADLYYRRTIWLIVFGLFNGYVLMWPGDILFAYGLFGLFLFPLRKLSPIVLIAAALLWLSIGALHDTVVSNRSLAAHAAAARVEQAEASGEEPAAGDRRAAEKWQESVSELNPGEHEVAGMVQLVRSGYLDHFVGLAPIVAMVETEMVYHYFVWDVLGMMMLGMALFKLGVFSAGLGYGQYVAMAIVGYAIGIPINLHECAVVESAAFDPLAQLSVNSTYHLGRLTVAVGHIGSVMLLCKSGALRMVTSPLAAVGRMALTNYLMQSVICGLLFYGHGFALYGALERHQLYYVVAGVWLFQLAISPLWLRYFRFGPCEWLWRSLTYVRLQPMRRASV